MVSTADAWHRAVKKIIKVTLLYGTYRELMEALGLSSVLVYETAGYAASVRFNFMCLNAPTVCRVERKRLSNTGVEICEGSYY